MTQQQQQIMANTFTLPSDQKMQQAFDAAAERGQSNSCGGEDSSAVEQAVDCLLTDHNSEDDLQVQYLVDHVYEYAVDHNII